MFDQVSRGKIPISRAALRAAESSKRQCINKNNADGQLHYATELLDRIAERAPYIVLDTSEIDELRHCFQEMHRMVGPVSFHFLFYLDLVPFTPNIIMPNNWDIYIILYSVYHCSPASKLYMCEQIIK